MRIKNSLVARFMLATVLFLFMYSFVFIFVINTAQKEMYDTNIRIEAATHARYLESAVLQYFSGITSTSIEERLSYMNQNTLIKYLFVLDSNGKNIADSTDKEVHKQVSDLNSDQINYEDSDSLIVVTKPVVLESNVVGYVIIGYSKEQMFDQLDQVQNKMIVTGLIVILFGAIITLLFTRLHFKPIKEFIAKIKNVTAGDLNQKVDSDSFDELKQLSESFNEMTEKLRNTRQSLVNSLEKAEQSSKLKTEFLAQMSHEIRSPINTILSFTSLMREDLESTLPEEFSDYFLSINNAGARITRTIDMILDLSEIQTGTYETKFMVFDLVDEVLSYMVKEYNRPAQKKGLKIELCSEAENTLLYADQYMISQVFQNLIDNAIKYSHNGVIKVKLEDISDTELSAEVTDEGIGISEEFLENLFEPFRQEEQGYSRHFDGSGLGLALVKKYCELNNALISVESQKGEGTTFTIVFQKYISKPDYS